MSALISTIKTDQSAEDPKTALTVARDFLIRPRGIQLMVLLPSTTLISWAQLFFKNIGQGWIDLKTGMRNLNYLMNWIDFPIRVVKMCRSFVELKECLFSGSLIDIAEKASDVYVRTVFTSNLVSGTINMAHTFHIIDLSEAALSVIRTISVAATFALLISTLPQVKKHFFLFIETEIGTPQFDLALIRLGGKICLVAIAMFSLIGYFFAYVFATSLTLTVSTTFLALSLASHFYDELHVKISQKPIA
jgi:hypothetical protein